MDTLRGGDTVMLFCDAAGFACDTVFTVVCLGRCGTGQNIPRVRQAAGYLCLICAAPLYFASITNSWLRFGIRCALYFAFLMLARRIEAALAAYDACFAVAVCTITHNAFLTSLTLPLLEQEAIFVPIYSLNAVFCALVVYVPTCICYALAYRLAPLYDASVVGGARLTGLVCITVISLYLKEIQMPFTLAGAERGHELSLYFIVLQAALLACLVGFEAYQRNQRENTALRMQAVATEALLQNIRARQAHDETVRRLRHDLKNHMLALRTFIETDEKAEALSYIDDFLSHAARPGILFHTGRPLLDGLLGEKLHTACDAGIAFSVVVDFSASGFIKDFDLCTLIGNALDNAVEACMQLPEGQDRYIDIRGGQNGNMLTLRIRNSCLASTDINALPRTTKADKQAHGFGLGNMRRIVARYGGTMLTELEQPDRFSLTVAVPVPTGNSTPAV